MFARLLRSWFAEKVRPITAFLTSLHITPNEVTLAGLAMAVTAGFLIAFGMMLPAACALFLSGVLDALDGALARQSNVASGFGAFVDSIADHYGDFAVYVGVMSLALRSQDRTLALLTLLAMFGSVIGSHVRSRAGMLGVDTKDIGLFTRAERVAVLVLGLLTGFVAIAMAILAVGTHFTALQRLAHTIASARSRLPARAAAAVERVAPERHGEEARS